MADKESWDLITNESGISGVPVTYWTDSYDLLSEDGFSISIKPNAINAPAVPKSQFPKATNNPAPNVIPNERARYFRYVPIILKCVYFIIIQISIMKSK